MANMGIKWVRKVNTWHLNSAPIFGSFVLAHATSQHVRLLWVYSKHGDYDTYCQFLITGNAALNMDECFHTLSLRTQGRVKFLGALKYGSNQQKPGWTPTLRFIDQDCQMWSKGLTWQTLGASCVNVFQSQLITRRKCLHSMFQEKHRICIMFWSSIN